VTRDTCRIDEFESRCANQSANGPECGLQEAQDEEVEGVGEGGMRWKIARVEEQSEKFRFVCHSD
jgi:hypothetical protein